MSAYEDIKKVFDDVGRKIQTYIGEITFPKDFSTCIDKVYEKGKLSSVVVEPGTIVATPAEVAAGKTFMGVEENSPGESQTLVSQVGTAPSYTKKFIPPSKVNRILPKGVFIENDVSLWPVVIQEFFDDSSRATISPENIREGVQVVVKGANPEPDGPPDEVLLKVEGAYTGKPVYCCGVEFYPRGSQGGHWTEESKVTTRYAKDIVPGFFDAHGKCIENGTYTFVVNGYATSQGNASAKFSASVRHVGSYSTPLKNGITTLALSEGDQVLGSVKLHATGSGSDVGGSVYITVLR